MTGLSHTYIHVHSPLNSLFYRFDVEEIYNQGDFIRLFIQIT